jgi:hypothetical protein
MGSVADWVPTYWRCVSWIGEAGSGPVRSLLEQPGAATVTVLMEIVRCGYEISRVERGAL